MTLSYGDLQIILIAAIYFLAGGYALLFGISSIKNKKVNVSGLDQIGLTISRIIYGKSKIAEREKELQGPKKLKRYGILFVFIGIAFLAGGIILVVELFH